MRAGLFCFLPFLRYARTEETKIDHGRLSAMSSEKDRDQRFS